MLSTAEQLRVAKSDRCEMVACRKQRIVYCAVVRLEAHGLGRKRSHEEVSERHVCVSYRTGGTADVRPDKCERADVVIRNLTKPVAERLAATGLQHQGLQLGI